MAWLQPWLLVIDCLDVLENRRWQFCNCVVHAIAYFKPLVTASKVKRVNEGSYTVTNLANCCARAGRLPLKDDRRKQASIALVFARVQQ